MIQFDESNIFQNGLKPSTMCWLWQAVADRSFGKKTPEENALGEAKPLRSARHPMRPCSLALSPLTGGASAGYLYTPVVLSETWGHNHTTHHLSTPLWISSSNVGLGRICQPAAVPRAFLAAGGAHQKLEDYILRVACASLDGNPSTTLVSGRLVKLATWAGEVGTAQSSILWSGRKWWVLAILALHDDIPMDIQLPCDRYQKSIDCCSWVVVAGWWKKLKGGWWWGGWW